MKLGVVGIIVEGDKTVASQVQAVLSEYGELIIGRMGLPHIDQKVSLISVGVKGSIEKISAMTGKLGRIAGVKVKTAVSDVDIA